jgi:DNA-binding transcriptional regulator YdaS (Cro superfamily)
MKTQDAIDLFGSGRAVAHALGITPAAVYQWGDYVPLARQFELQRITRGKLRATGGPRRANGNGKRR